MTYKVQTYWLPEGDAETERFESKEEAAAVFLSYRGRRDVIDAFLWAGDDLLDSWESGKEAVVMDRDRDFEDNYR